mgnify:CR=1 FL=1
MRLDHYASGITQPIERPPKAGWTVTDLEPNEKARRIGLLMLAEREGFEHSVFSCFSAGYKGIVSRSCLTAPQIHSELGCITDPWYCLHKSTFM